MMHGFARTALGDNKPDLPKEGTLFSGHALGFQRLAINVVWMKTLMHFILRGLDLKVLTKVNSLPQCLGCAPGNPYWPEEAFPHLF